MAGLVVGALVGVGALAAGWHGVAYTLLVGQQVPWLVSGAVVGLALIGTSLAVLALFLERRQLALRAQQTDELVQATARLAARIERAVSRQR